MRSPRSPWGFSWQLLPSKIYPTKTHRLRHRIKKKGLPRRADPLKKEPACGGSLTAAYSNQILMASIRFAFPTVPVTSPSFAGSIQP